MKQMAELLHVHYTCMWHALFAKLSLMLITRFGHEDATGIACVTQHGIATFTNGVAFVWSCVRRRQDGKDDVDSRNKGRKKDVDDTENAKRLVQDLVDAFNGFGVSPSALSLAKPDWPSSLESCFEELRLNAPQDPRLGYAGVGLHPQSVHAVLRTVFLMLCCCSV